MSLQKCAGSEIAAVALDTDLSAHGVVVVSIKGHEEELAEVEGGTFVRAFTPHNNTMS
jgi:hypothetical protein